MSGKPNNDRRSVRRQETQAEIVRASWELVREHGLAGLSLRDLGERVGMRAQSIYSYFGSKHEIYDAMFREGYQAFAAHMEDSVDDERLLVDPVGTAQSAGRAFVHFCTSDPVRYQLLFQRTIPDFVPSAQSYAIAVEVYDLMKDRMAAIGVGDAADLDLWTAMMTGLADQQMANDPGGERWTRLVDRAVEILLGAFRSGPETESERT